MWSLSLHLVLTIIVGVAGWQDWKTREVSNIITIPFFTAGIATIIWRAVFSRTDGTIVGFSLFVIGILTIAAYQGWMGGADWKVLVGLWGLWPLAGLVALIGAGIWGMMTVFFMKKKSFAGLSIYAISMVLLVLITPVH